jgi:Ca2+-binding EF-hand superfamily protein
MEKNKDLVLAKELFKCWDERRLGHIDIIVLSDNLISFGLSMSKDDVMKLLQTLQSGEGSADQITMREFIKIFERDTFGDKATKLIKAECARKKIES